MPGRRFAGGEAGDGSHGGAVGGNTYFCSG